ncbi:hypothetical protein [Planctopirus hydrillae]|uniref:Uncharacterized protein n=1 Tax=Planctopirus hydrillae TaxID=1841610 RepID=A0A1C3E8V3_9PLAN|nr:hypothetical protein [Planctopirus hydrillae]ODA29663.1 hypothetical protein A6X21_08325 [Planctopirus hydrillae]
MSLRTLACSAAILLGLIPALADAQLVPGTGTLLSNACDDFEDENWNFTYNLPKASSNIDKTVRHPAGFSANYKWHESTYRGTPDFVKRVETPAGGIPGSKGALAIQTLNSGIPGQLSGKFQQDDLIAGVAQTIGYLPVNRSPSFVVRVYMPPFEQWEKRTGSQFGFRTDCQTTINNPAASSGFGRLRRNSTPAKKLENYWPGFFVQFNRKADGYQEDHAILLLRSGSRGEDVPGPKITQPGWWTLGMSFTPDGQVHYYAHPGVEDLKASDHLYSSFPYSYRCEQVNTFFFNIVNMDDGKTWSTRFIVDDPKIYSVR